MTYILNSNKQLLALQEDPQLDRFDHFANFVAAQLRTKPSEHADLYMRSISNIVLSAVEIAVVSDL